MLTVIFKKTPTQDGPGSGEWRGAMVGHKRVAILCCPTCGTSCSISDHVIKDNGDVTPSLVCPRDGCGFHAMASLEDWMPFKSAEKEQ